MKFSNYINEKKEEDLLNEIKINLVTLSFLMEQEELLNEAELNEELLVEGLGDMLNKFGIKIHKGDGLIDYIKKFATGTGKLILAAIKGDKKKVKEIASSIDKAQVVDFLLKLDMATMHIVTGPIHFIDAVTGWDLAANLKHAAKSASTLMAKIKTLFVDLKQTAKKAFERYPKKLKAIDNLESQIVY